MEKKSKGEMLWSSNNGLKLRIQPKLDEDRWAHEGDLGHVLNK